MLRIQSRVREALAARAPVVALESSVLAQGLPSPQNRQAAQRMVAALERRAVVPAITAGFGGRARAGGAAPTPPGLGRLSGASRARGSTPTSSSAFSSATEFGRSLPAIFPPRSRSAL